MCNGVKRSGTTWPVPVLSVNQYNNPYSASCHGCLFAWPTPFFCHSQGICFTEDLSCDVEWEWSLEVHCFYSVTSLSAFGKALHTSSVVLLSDSSLTTRQRDALCVGWREVMRGSVLWSPTNPKLGKGSLYEVEIVTFQQLKVRSFLHSLGLICWDFHVTLGYLRLTTVYFFVKMGCFLKQFSKGEMFINEKCKSPGI